MTSMSKRDSGMCQHGAAHECGSEQGCCRSLTNTKITSIRGNNSWFSSRRWVFGNLATPGVLGRSTWVPGTDFHPSSSYQVSSRNSVSISTDSKSRNGGNHLTIKSSLLFSEWCQLLWSKFGLNTFKKCTLLAYCSMPTRNSCCEGG